MAVHDQIKAEHHSTVEAVAVLAQSAAQEEAETYLLPLQHKATTEALEALEAVAVVAVELALQEQTHPPLRVLAALAEMESATHTLDLQ